MSNTDNIDDLTGSILLSTPSISDKYIPRSMILITHHSKDGAGGVIINKPFSEVELFSTFLELQINNEYFKRRLLLEEYAEGRLYIGGHQCRDTYYILHTYMDFDNSLQLKINQGLFLTESHELLDVINIIHEESIRKMICVGCYKWEASQLEQEIASNFWLPIKADEALIFGNSSVDKWSKAFLKIGLKSPLFLDKYGRA